MQFAVDVLEELDSRGLRSGVEAEDYSSQAIHDPFDPDKIDVITRTPTVDLMISRLRGAQLDLQPDFQRCAGIWNDKAKSRLIESLLLRIPLPTFYAAEAVDESWVMVDGIQRMTAIAQYVAPDALGLSPLRLEQLEYLGDQCDGRLFHELPGRLQTRLRETEIVVHLIRLGTPEQVKFNIFARINTGGVPLSAQELRHALIPGKARDVLRDWASSEEFKAATGGSVSSERMADREMVLRFVAFRMADPSAYAADELDTFLREAMKRVNGLGERSVARLRTDFAIALDASLQIFGPYAFRKRNPDFPKRRLPVNKALFEAVTVSLAEHPGWIPKLVKRRKLVETGFLELMKHQDFQVSISQGTGDVAKVKRRFEMIRWLFERVVK